MKKFFVFILSFIAGFSLFSFTSCKDTPLSVGKYDINVKYDGESISGSLSYSFESSFGDIKFNLYGNAYREGAKYFVSSPENSAIAYPEGITYGKTDISAVYLNGKPADYELIGEDLNILSVSLKEKRDGENTVKIEFSTSVPNCKNRLGKSGKTVRLTGFFPVACAKCGEGYYECVYSPYGDPYFSEVNDYNISLTVPSKFSVAASAYPNACESSGEFTTYNYSVLNYRDFAFALGEDYTVTVGKSQHADVYYYSESEDNENVELVKNALNYFSEIFGAYPYKTFTVAETPLFCAGMEYSGMCYISDSLSSEDKKLALIHEIAHEWWHGAVGFNEVEEAYLDEGLAQYSTYLFFKNNGYAEKTTAMLEDAKTAYKSFFDIKTLLSGEADTTMKRPLKDFKSEYEYINIAYNKSLVMFTEYGNAVGEKRAIKGLSAFYKNNLYSVATADDLIKSLGLEEFFNSYISGKVII